MLSFYSSNKHETYKIVFKKVEQRISEGRKRKGKMLQSEIDFNILLMAFVKLICSPQYVDGNKVLDISDNEKIAEILVCTPRQVKSIRERLSSLDITFVPPYGRQTGKGTYPMWLIHYKYLIHKKSHGLSKKFKRPLLAKYTQSFKDIYEEEKQDIREYFISIGVKAVEIGSFMRALNDSITLRLRSMGMTRADFRI